MLRFIRAEGALLREPCLIRDSFPLSFTALPRKGVGEIEPSTNYPISNLLNKIPLHYTLHPAQDQLQFASAAPLLAVFVFF